MNTNLPNLVYYSLAGSHISTALRSALAIATGKYNVEHCYDYDNTPVVLLAKNSENKRVPKISASYKIAEEYYSKEELDAMPFARTVEVVFNGIKVIVNHDSDIQLLMRDWRLASNGWLANSRVVGPYPKAKLTSEEQAFLNEARYQRAIRRHQYDLEYQERERQKLQVYKTAMAATPEYLVGNQEALDKWIKANTKDDDGSENYGSIVITVAMDYGRLLQAEMDKGRQMEDVMEECEKPLYTHGITGFQWGAVKSVLSSTWLYGGRAYVYFANDSVTHDWRVDKRLIEKANTKTYNSMWVQTLQREAKRHGEYYAKLYESFVSEYAMYLKAVQAGEESSVTSDSLKALKSKIEDARESWKKARTDFTSASFHDEEYFQEELKLEPVEA